MFVHNLAYISPIKNSHSQLSVALGFPKLEKKENNLIWCPTSNSVPGSSQSLFHGPENLPVPCKCIWRQFHQHITLRKFYMLFHQAHWEILKAKHCLPLKNSAISILELCLKVLWRGKKKRWRRYNKNILAWIQWVMVRPGNLAFSPASVYIFRCPSAWTIQGVTQSVIYL